MAAATHPDRADGGDLARYTAASAAYAELRTPWSRSEAYADLAGQAGLAGAEAEPVTVPLPVIAAGDLTPADLPWAPPWALWQLPARIRRGRPLRLAIRAAIAAALSLAVLQLIPGTAAALADITGLMTWFVLTGRRDLAPAGNGEQTSARVRRPLARRPEIPAPRRAHGAGRGRLAGWPRRAPTRAGAVRIGEVGGWPGRGLRGRHHGLPGRGLVAPAGKSGEPKA